MKKILIIFVATLTVTQLPCFSADKICMENEKTLCTEQAINSWTALVYPPEKRVEDIDLDLVKGLEVRLVNYDTKEGDPLNDLFYYKEKSSCSNESHTLCSN